MELKKTSMQGLFLLHPTVHVDERGHFFESFNQEKFNELIGEEINFVQDNQSKSKQGVLRGLHLQTGEWAQDKLVRVLSGAVMDVVVDLRPDSDTFGKNESFILSEGNKQMLFVPKGFAHGFIALADDTVFCYKCSNYYHKESEAGIL